MHTHTHTHMYTHTHSPFWPQRRNSKAVDKYCAFLQYISKISRLLIHTHIKMKQFKNRELSYLGQRYYWSEFVDLELGPQEVVEKMALTDLPHLVVLMTYTRNTSFNCGQLHSAQKIVVATLSSFLIIKAVYVCNQNCVQFY